MAGMLDVFDGLLGHFKLEETRRDNYVFILHYKVTTIILLAFAAIITAGQYIGDPIDCIVDEIPAKLMDNYCWIQSTYTVVNVLGGRVGKDIVQPGVGQHIEGETEIKRHLYYQWVCFSFLFQVILFHVPRYIWKAWEKGLLQNLSSDLTNPLVADAVKEKRIDVVVKYFKTHNQNNYAYKFFFCEVLNFINVVGQIYFMDFFLDGEFLNYGKEVINYATGVGDLEVNPMVRVFPKITKCTFNKFGPSGTVMDFDGLCVLPLNIVNEKLYVFLWFWFVALSIISAAQLLWRLATIFFWWARNLGVTGDSSIKRAVKNVSRSVGDWFLLSMLSDLVDPLHFAEVLQGLQKEI